MKPPSVHLKLFEIILNGAEQKLATHLAKSRYANNRANNVKDLKVGTASNETVDLEGMAGEIAYCKLMNLYVDMETNPPVMPSYDCITHHGVKVDVKTTPYRNGHLIATLKKIKNPPDKYVLVVGELPTYSVVGEVWSVDLLKEGNIKDFGYGPCYALTQSELNPIVK